MNELTKNDTFFLKGVAVILLLIHHLFYINSGLYDDFYICGQPLVQTIGVVSKVCVSIFVFLSGYGLVRSNSVGHFSVFSFYVKGLTKLYANYWLIYLLFVPVGILFFNRMVYRTPLDAGIDIMGFARSFKTPTYNPTWWFYSCILPLYLLFPLLRGFLSKKKYAALLWAGGIAVMYVPALFLLEPIRIYLLSFIVGMLFAHYNLLTYISSIRFFDNFFIWIVFLLCAIYWRQYGSFMIGEYFDLILALVGMCLFVVIRRNRIIKSKFMFFMGKHSFNIFLFHTFIFYLYFPQLIYATSNPIVIFLSLLISCMILSWAMEKLKKVLHFYELQSKVISKLNYNND